MADLDLYDDRYLSDYQRVSECEDHRLPRLNLVRRKTRLRVLLSVTDSLTMRVPDTIRLDALLGVRTALAVQRISQAHPVDMIGVVTQVIARNGEIPVSQVELEVEVRVDPAVLTRAMRSTAIQAEMTSTRAISVRHSSGVVAQTPVLVTHMIRVLHVLPQLEQTWLSRELRVVTTIQTRRSLQLHPVVQVGVRARPQQFASVPPNFDYVAGNLLGFGPMSSTALGGGVVPFTRQQVTPRPVQVRVSMTGSARRNRQVAMQDWVGVNARVSHRKTYPMILGGSSLLGFSPLGSTPMSAAAITIAQWPVASYRATSARMNLAATTRLITARPLDPIPPNMLKTSDELLLYSSEGFYLQTGDLSDAP